MENYAMKGTDGEKEAEFVICATHPAPVGTYIVYAEKDGSSDRTTVIAWGVVDDCTIVPMTLSGVWDGVSNRNSFVLHPDGSCGRFEENWATLDEAMSVVKQFEP